MPEHASRALPRSPRRPWRQRPSGQLPPARRDTGSAPAAAPHSPCLRGRRALLRAGVPRPEPIASTLRSRT
jgi:hypothetical protein